MRIANTTTNFLRVQILAAAIFFAPASLASAQGSTWIVDVNGGAGAHFTQIQPALDAAQSGDTILVKDGTYKGSGNKNLNFHGKILVLRSENGPANCIVDPESDGHGFVFNQGETAQTEVLGITIRNAGVYKQFVDLGNFGYTYSADGNGGGIVCVQASPTIKNCVFSNCFSEGYENTPAQGGAATLTGSDSVFQNCAFLENSTYNGSGAANGGAVFSESGSPQLLGCLFAKNSAGWLGGAVFLSGSVSPSLRNCTIADNSCGMAQGGGGVTGVLVNLKIENCIFRNNEAAGLSHQLAAFGNALVHYSDLQGGAAAITKVPGTGSSYLAVDWQAGNIDLNPQFADPSSNDYRLLASSPCIDAGSNAQAPAGLAKDLGGKPRFVDAPSVCDSGEGEVPVIDMGAYEYQPAPGPWANLGKALASGSGKPCLIGEGILAPASLASLTLSNAKASAPCFLVIGVHDASIPFKGGVLVPTPDRVFALASTGSSGTLALAALWPTGFPAGAPIYFQYWIADNSGTMGFSASNAISATDP